MESSEQIIRLIIDNEADNIGVAVGLTEKRTDEMDKEVFAIYAKHRTMSARMKEITETYHHPAEVSYALYSVGVFSQKVNCPIHALEMQMLLMRLRDEGKIE